MKKLLTILTFVCFAGQAWYLIARPADEKLPKTYRIARFQSLRMLDFVAQTPAKFDLDEYFGNAWGVFRGKESFDVAIEFTRDAAALVTEVARMLKPGGVGMAIFSTVRSDAQPYRKYVMVDEHHLRHRSYPAAQGPNRLWSSRDVQLLLANLEVDESFLLTHRQRETLFHKPTHTDGSR